MVFTPRISVQSLRSASLVKYKGILTEEKIKKHTIVPVLCFKDLESMQSDEKVDGDVDHWIEVGWVKYVNALNVI